MYLRFFGLKSDPFGMTPNPACLFLTAQHREAFAGLAYAILNRRGFGVLTGDAGTGKTTLVAKVLASMPKDKVQTSIVFHPTLSTSDFLELVMIDFGITDVPPTKAQRLARLQNFLLERHQIGKISTLIVDEAHKLSPRLLEEIRLLGNFDYTDQKLLQILLVGQTELDDVLTLENLRQLKQRIAIRLRIEPLALTEVEAYIRYRWMRAGGNDPVPFTCEAINEIARSTRALPRVINAVCDNALLVAFAEESRTVELAHVQQSVADLKVGVKTADPLVTSNGNLSTIVVPALVPDTTELVKPAVLTAPAEVPSPIRIPELSLIDKHPSLWARWAGKLIGSV